MAVGDPSLADVSAAHRFDVAALEQWLSTEVEGFGGPLSVRQFQGGQSNPTFLLQAGGRRAVLRKKPPGKLLPKAHDVVREHRILHALAATDVPVARMLGLCEDPSVIGTEFYVMDFVTGRIFETPAMPGVDPALRKAMHLATVDALASLHKVDVDRVGLSDFGPRQGYVARQAERWSRQYGAASAAGEIADLAWLADWLREHQDVADETTIAHGDFRHGNLCYGPDGGVQAIFDWELSTLGHPLSDLAYLTMSYHIEADGAGSRGLGGLDFAALGIPPEQAILERYCEAMSRDLPGDWPVFQALAFFRLSAILHGVMARALQGNASNPDAMQVAGRAGALAAIGRRLASAADT